MPPDRQGVPGGGAGADPAEPDRAALAAEALAQAKADAAARGNRPSAAAEDTLAQRKAFTPVPAASQQAARERREDPAPLGAAINGLVAETGWEFAVATGSVFGRWAQIVGPDLAAHTALVRKLNAELGDGAVRRVKVRGPGTQRRRPGEWRVRGSRGPRDTYG